jgi:hypothetical protein
MLSKSAQPINIPVSPSSVPTTKAEKLVPLSRIREIVRKLTDSSTADAIIAKIEEELD